MTFMVHSTQYLSHTQGANIYLNISLLFLRFIGENQCFLIVFLPPGFFFTAVSNSEYNFIAADCGPPPSIPYADYDPTTLRTLEDDVVTYTCDSNTVAEGNPTTTCLVSGKWSSINLYCRREFYQSFAFLLFYYLNMIIKYCYLFEY